MSFSPSAVVAANRIERLRAGASSVNLATAMNDAVRLLESSDIGRRELYVFTDLSHGGWEQPVQADWDTLHPSVNLVFIDVSATHPQDFMLESLELSAERLTVGSPLNVSVTTRRVGPESARSVAVGVSGSGRRLCSPGRKSPLSGKTEKSKKYVLKLMA